MTVTATVLERTQWRELYAYGHKKLGYAQHSAGSKQYNYEVVILGRVLRARHVTPDEFRLAVDYCAAIGRTVSRPSEVLYKLQDAKAWAKPAVPKKLELDVQIEEAIESERSHPRPETSSWVERLLRARGDGRVDVLAEWAQSRG